MLLGAVQQQCAARTASSMGNSSVREGGGEGTGKPPAAYATSGGCISNQCTPCSWARVIGDRGQNANGTL